MAVSSDVCSGCEYNFYDAGAFSNDRVKEELLRHGIWRDHTNCGRCGNPLRAEDRGRFHCGKQIRRVKKRPVVCGWSKTIWSGTFFERTYLQLITLWRFILALLTMPPPRQCHLEQFLDLSSKTITDLYVSCREVLVYSVLSTSEKLGGEGRVVEVDVAKFGWLMYGRGRITGRWFFGGIERETGCTFLVPLEKCSAATLVTALKEWVLPGTTVVGDCWQVYNCLRNEAFCCLMDSYTYSFLDPEMGGHTNVVKRTWREVRVKVPRYGQKKERAVGHLAEYLFKAKYPNMATRLHHFLIAAAGLYSPDY
ncbi:uncharacterized protein LOC111641213 [Centruroides sculpturatus]|uniref:uncharacterized protein LOC111641213 n=1 Tax=Centruroides sculpturatus TaxID=218467 RepID=UPI000C6E0391|nr:uncharacterized protein LOC111641213 [Centruroides sculpturatus]